MFRFGLLSKGINIPRTNLLAYITRPTSDNVLIGEGEEYPESTVDWGFVLTQRPGVAIEDLWAAVGHTSGEASYWFDADDEPITRLAVGITGTSTEGEGISELAGINTSNVLFKLVDAEQQTGRLAVYAAGTDAAILAEARDYLKIPEA